MPGQIAHYPCPLPKDRHEKADQVIFHQQKEGISTFLKNIHFGLEGLDIQLAQVVEHVIGIELNVPEMLAFFGLFVHEINAIQGVKDFLVWG